MRGWLSTVRLFVAVHPPPDAVAHLDAAVGVRDERVRWVPTSQWHVTLVFCGEVTEPVAADLTERLRRAAARTAPLSLRLTGAGSFPRQAARARVLWVRVDGDVPELTRLAERCSAAARRAGIALDTRGFRPHLTLARARRDAVDLRDTVGRLASYDGSPWPVTTLRLIRSTLGPQPRHETLHEFDLSSGDSA